MANTVANWGQFIPTTSNVDVSQIYEVNVNSEEFKELLVRLYQTVNNIAMATNIKDSGYYLTTEFVTGALLFDPANNPNNLRPIYRVEIDFGALPAAGTKSVAHGIPDITVAGTTTFSAVKILGGSVNPSTSVSIPIPYASGTAADNLEITIDATNVNITTGGTDYSAWTRTYIMFEYVKQ